MKGTIIDYLKKYGDCSLTDMPMNEVDSLILCQLSYLKFDGMVGGIRKKDEPVTLWQLAEKEQFGKLFADERYEKANRALFDVAVLGKRFRNLKLNYYMNLVEKEWETQFSAITFLLEDGTIYIAYRGTDETLIGWKEDFNMAFLSPTPGQAYSVKYLNMVTKLVSGDFYIGGHSKGGNFAVYSAMNCVPDVQERICSIYSMDGPGFRPEVLKQCGYSKIEGRVKKILPHSSLIGMLFEKEIHYKVVESKGFGLAQHDPFTWLVADKEFMIVEDVYESRLFMDAAINEWILTLDEKQLENFVDTLYQVISATKAENLIGFGRAWHKNMNSMVKAYKELDEETVKMMTTIIKSLFEITAKRWKSKVNRGLPFKKARYLPRK